MVFDRLLKFWPILHSKMVTIDIFHMVIKHNLQSLWQARSLQRLFKSRILGYDVINLVHVFGAYTETFNHF